MKKIKVVLSGIFYPLAMLSYFWKALERRDDIELYTIGPFTNDYIPWSQGMRLPRKYVKSPNYVFTPEFIGRSIPFELIKSVLPWKPDLWLQIDAGWHFSNRPDATVVAHVQTDPHVLKPHYKLPKSYSDVCFNMQHVYLEGNEQYLPYAYDPFVFYPEKLPKEYDACLIGLHYPQRDELVRNLRATGMKVYYSIGEIFDEYRMMYNKSKVSLSWSSLLDLPARVFEGMGMGLPLVSNRVPDFPNFFVEGEHYLGFDTVSEAVKQVRTLLDDPKLAKKIGAAAERKVRAGHTWDHRIQTILETCKLV